MVRTARLLIVCAVVALAHAVLLAATNTDAFTYSDGELNSVSSGTWVNLRTGGQTASITSNALGSGATNFDAPYRYNTTYAGAALYSQVAYAVTAGGAEFAVIINATTDTDTARDYYILEWTQTTSTILLGKIVNGSFTSLDTVGSITLVANDVLRLENDGSGVLTGKINGTPIATLGATDTDLTGVRVGVMPSSSGSERLDDWEGGDLSASVPPAPKGLFLTGAGR